MWPLTPEATRSAVSLHARIVTRYHHTDHGNAWDTTGALPNWRILGRNCLRLTHVCHSCLSQPALPEELPRPGWCNSQSTLCMHAECADSPKHVPDHSQIRGPSACIKGSQAQSMAKLAATSSGLDSRFLKLAQAPMHLKPSTSLSL